MILIYINISDHRGVFVMFRVEKKLKNSNNNGGYEREASGCS